MIFGGRAVDPGHPLWLTDNMRGDTIVVLPGTYTGEGNRDIDLLGKAITIKSEDPENPDVVAATVIEAAPPATAS